MRFYVRILDRFSDQRSNWLDYMYDASNGWHNTFGNGLMSVHINTAFPNDTWIYAHDAVSYGVYSGFTLPSTASGMTVNCNYSVCRNTSTAMSVVWSENYLNKNQLDCFCDTRKRHVMAHELGHALGLFHHANTLMNSTPNSITTPTSTDLGAKPPCSQGNDFGGLRCVWNYTR